MTAAIDKLRQLDDNELDALIELAQTRANSEMSKRDFLKAAGVLGAGAALGGGGAAALTGDAKAAVSTVDGDGDVGTPDNPEDVFADALAVFDGANNQIGGFDETGIETPALNTDKIAITDSGVVDHGDISSGSGSSVTISFAQSYNDPPTILHEVGTTGGGTNALQSSTNDVTAADFDSVVRNDAGSTVTVNHVSYGVISRD